MSTKNTQVGIPSPNPSYPSPVEVVTGENEVVVSNKNMINTNELEHGTISQTDGKTITTNNSISHTDYIPVEPNSSYMLSSNASNLTARYFTYDSNKNYITTGLLTYPFSIPSGVYYIRLQLNDSFISNLMLEKGSTATSYVPHTEQTYPISLGSIELAKIGSYQDKPFKAINGDVVYDSLSDTQKEGLNSGSWYKGSDTGEVVLNGSETWTNSGTNSKNFYYMMKTVIPDMKSAVDDYEVLEVKSNYFSDGFSYASLGNSDAGTNGICVAQNHTLTICNSSYNKTQTADFKTWLSTHNVIVRYVLATPTFTEITDETLIEQLENWRNSKSYQGQTNISQTNDDKAFVISYTTLKDVYAELDSRLKALEG